MRGLKFIKNPALALAGALSLAACTTRHEVVSDYQEAVRQAPVTDSKGRPTVVLFLIDGFSVPVAKKLLMDHQLPEIQNHFLKDQNSFHVGRAQFPTLTYVNISSILTSRPVDQHPVIGNQVLIDDRKFNFESAAQRTRLADAIRPYSIFTDLSNQSRTSLSLAHYFGDGATARVQSDIESGLAYQREDYRYIDQKLVDSAKTLLSKTSPAQWPEFVFIHLCGVDSLSHTYGPFSQQALDYASRMDHMLGPLFQILRDGEAHGKKVVTMMTADHGFASIHKYVNVEKLIRHQDPKITLFNQHRLITVYYPHAKGGLRWTPESQSALATELVAQPGVAMTARRIGNGVRVERKGAPIVIDYVSAICAETTYALRVDGGPALCPEMIDQAPNPVVYPYFVTSLARYFHSPYHPDLIVLADEHYSFTPKDAGHHGGFTPEETLVPIFMRNTSLRDPSVATPTYKLLRAVRMPVTQADPASTLVAPETYEPEQEPVQTKPKYAVEFAAPFRSWSMDTSNNADHKERSFKTDPSVGLEGQFHQFWTKEIGTVLGYEFEFTNLHETSNQFGPNKPNQGTQFTQHFKAGGQFRFGEKEEIEPSLGWGQHYFATSDGTVERVYIPDFNLESKTKVYSFFLGDLGVIGGLSFLGSSHQNGYAVDVGFGQKVGLEFSHGVGVDDETAAKFTLEHVAQNTTIQSQSEFKLGLEFSYQLSLNGR